MTHVFDKDERKRIKVNTNWSADTLLQQEGMIPLKDALKILPIKKDEVIRAYRDMEKSGEDAYKALGVRKLWHTWIIRMTVFAPFYRANLAPKYQKVDPSWDTETLLRQTGTFLLSDVFHLTPFTAHQLRHQCQLLKNARQEMGVYKDPNLKRYLVDMPIFQRWLSKLWLKDPSFLPEQNASRD